MSSRQHQQALDKESHVSFLEKKKAEILARKKQQEAASVAVVKTEEVAAPKKALPFANDGSFMERFKAMQKKQPSSQPPPPPPPQVKREVQPPEPPKSVSKTAKTYEPTKLALVFKEEAYEAAQHDQERARELAEKVAQEGPDAEALALSDPSYSFLLEPKHTLAKFYKGELKRCRNEQASRKRRWNEQLRLSTSTKASSSSSTASSSSATAGSSSSTAPINPLTEFEKAKALVRAKAAALMGGVVPPVVDSEEEKRKQKAVEEQKMMNAIYEKVIQQQIVAAMEASVKREEDKPKYEYDSDEDTEGGTWEHKKRHHEMMKTLEWAKDLTENGSGKHHLSDFLPPDELDKFMEKVKAVKEGREVDFSDYVKFKIQEDNIGFKMLQKAGWKEGEGLGAKGEGIVNPINKGKVSFDQSGVGTESVAEVKEDDDDFDLYRKRMMLAYKFRPNPLNNPRRPYYS